MRQMFPCRMWGADGCGTPSPATLLRKSILNENLGCFLGAGLMDNQADSAASAPLWRNGSKGRYLVVVVVVMVIEKPRKVHEASCERTVTSLRCVLPPHSSLFPTNKPPPG